MNEALLAMLVAVGYVAIACAVYGAIEDDVDDSLMFWAAVWPITLATLAVAGIGFVLFVLPYRGMRRLRGRS